MDLALAAQAHVDAVLATVERNGETIARVAAAIVDCYKHGGKVLACGNGGSAADAQHFAAEFMNRMHLDRPPLPAIALSTDSSVLTSVANDSAYELVFVRQVEALGRSGDVLVGFSTSGGSANVLAALRNARERGLVTIGFTGEGGAVLMSQVCDHLVVAASRETPRIQECHELIYHHVAAVVELELAPS